MTERHKYNPAWLLTLPLTIVYALHCLIIYRAHSWRWISGRFECIAGRKWWSDGSIRSRIWGQPNAQNIGGRLIVYDKIENRSNALLRHHELVHTKQGEQAAIVGLLWGLPLAWHVHPALLWLACLAFPVTYGIAFAWKYRTLNFWKAYRANHYEVEAYDEMKTLEPGEWT
jgi:hypothetical protein